VDNRRPENDAACNDNDVVHRAVGVVPSNAGVGVEEPGDDVGADADSDAVAWPVAAEARARQHEESRPWARLAAAIVGLAVALAVPLTSCWRPRHHFHPSRPSILPLSARFYAPLRARNTVFLQT
jgi:hypothetical protein